MDRSHRHWIVVTDTGTGISGDIQERIFEPFFTTKKLGEGTGLGLAGVYGCVKAHGGSIDLKSRLGKGAEFMILLPLTEELADASEPKQISVSDSRAGRVLVVEDEEGVRKFVTTALERHGYEVSAVADGQAAVEFYRQKDCEIDVVFLDVIMPRLGGIDTFRALKELDSDVNVILTSGFTQAGFTEDLRAEGVRAILGKPFTIQELTDLVAEELQGTS